MRSACHIGLSHHAKTIRQHVGQRFPAPITRPKPRLPHAGETRVLLQSVRSARSTPHTSFISRVNRVPNSVSPSRVLSHRPLSASCSKRMGPLRSHVSTTRGHRRRTNVGRRYRAAGGAPVLWARGVLNNRFSVTKRAMKTAIQS